MGDFVYVFLLYPARKWAGENTKNNFLTRPVPGLPTAKMCVCVCLVVFSLPDLAPPQVIGAESTEKRNANRRNFLSQTCLSPAKPQWGLLEKSQSPAIFRRKKKSQGSLGGGGGEGTLFGLQKSLRIFHLRQKIAIAIAEDSRHLVHSASECWKGVVWGKGAVCKNTGEAQKPPDGIFEATPFKILHVPVILGTLRTKRITRCNFKTIACSKLLPFSALNPAVTIHPLIKRVGLYLEDTVSRCFVYQDSGHTQTLRICHIFVLSLLVSRSTLPPKCLFCMHGKSYTAPNRPGFALPIKEK